MGITIVFADLNFHNEVVITFYFCVVKHLPGNKKRRCLIFLHCCSGNSADLNCPSCVCKLDVDLAEVPELWQGFNVNIDTKSEHDEPDSF